MAGVSFGFGGAPAVPAGPVFLSRHGKKIKKKDLSAQVAEYLPVARAG